MTIPQFWECRGYDETNGAPLNVNWLFLPAYGNHYLGAQMNILAPRGAFDIGMVYEFKFSGGWRT